MMTSSHTPIRIVYLHGRGSTKDTKKATFLVNAKDAEGNKPFEVLAETYATEDLKASTEWAAKFLERVGKIDVLAGSSYGGAVAVNLLRSGKWNGPTLLLAQAYALYVGEHRVPDLGLPENRLVTLVHGSQDDIVPVSGSRALAKTGTKDMVKLIEFEDGHRLERLTTDKADVYFDAIRELYDLGQALGFSLE